MTEGRSVDLAGQILDASEHGMFAVDRDLRVTFWNRRMEVLSGRTRDLVIGQLVFDTMPSWRTSCHVELLRALAGATIKAPTFPILGFAPPRRFEATYMPLGSPAEVTGVAVALQDVTSIDVARQQADEAAARFRVMADAAPVLLWIAGNDALCTFFNQGWLEFTGRSLEMELGNGWAEGVHPEDFQRCMDTYLAAFVAREPFRMEYRLRRHDGEYRWLLDTGVPRLLRSGQFVGYIGSCIDITDMKAARDDLDQRVRERTAELEAFTYSVSHDLRSPLRSIDGFGRALLEGYHDRLDEKGQHYLERVRLAAQHMGALIDGLLQLSRIGRREMQLVRCDATHLAHQVIGELREQEPARAIEIAIEDNMLVQADPQLLRIALDNLIGNAWKFTARTAAPRIEIASTTREGGFVLVVRDNGVGFDMQYAGKLFGAFQRLHRPSDFGGTGIGLATVAKIASRHRGTIWAEAAVDKGATFYLGFPRS